MPEPPLDRLFTALYLSVPVSKMTAASPAPPSPVPAPYPWHTLERLPRAIVGALRDARRTLTSAVRPEAVGAALGRVLGAPVEVLVVGTDRIASNPPPLGGITVSFTDRTGLTRVGIEIERDLALRLVGRLVGRPFRLADATAKVPDPVAGAAAAMLAEIARRAYGDEGALRPLGLGLPRAADGEPRIAIEATILAGNEAFAARALVFPSSSRAFAPQRRSAPKRTYRPVLGALGDLPIAMPVVAACSLVHRAELADLALGDVWMPDAGWTVRGLPPSGTVLLAAPAAERGLRCALGDDGKIVVGGVGAAPLEPSEGVMENPEDDGRYEQDQAERMAAAVLEAPLVVRVELGTVSLTAREWSELGPGDVIALGRRVGEPAVLRVAGVEVASGELVDLEGELGVRIRALGLAPPASRGREAAG